MIFFFLLLSQTKKFNITITHLSTSLGYKLPHNSFDFCNSWPQSLYIRCTGLAVPLLFPSNRICCNCPREPCGTSTQIKIPEVKVSKLHAVITYDKHEQAYMVTDLGSVNGTFLNKDQRLSLVGEIY